MSAAKNILDRPVAGACLLWGVALALLTLCSFNTSPLNPFYGGDSTIYTVLGRMTAQGALPYADVYDHKGPLVFYIHALGCLLDHGKGGMLLLQSIALAASMLLTWRICRLWAGTGKSLAGLAMFAAVYAACLWGGDMTEEYSLPFVLLPAYLILQDLMRGKGLAELPLGGALAAGLGIGLTAFLRLNNAAPLCGLLLGLAGCIRERRDVIYLLRYAAVTLGGCVLAALPFVLYFAANDALQAMLAGTFRHNYNYALGNVAERSLTGTLAVAGKLTALPLFLLFLWLNRQRISAPRGAVTATAGFVVLSLLFPACGPESSHYFITAAPAIGLTLCLPPARRRFSLILTAGLLLLPFTADTAHLLAGFRRYNIIRNYQDDINAARLIVSHIPAGERNSVWACDAHAAIYVYGNILPCFRYFTLQSSHARHNPEIAPAIVRMLEKTPPRWIIVPTPPQAPDLPVSGQTSVQQALRSGAYTLEYRESEHLHLDLWRRNTP